MNTHETALAARAGQLTTTAAWALVGFLLVLAIGLGLVKTGGALVNVDEHHHHIPGHILYWTLLTAPALLQLLYVVPLRRVALRRGRVALARGFVSGAVLVAVLNALVLAMACFFAGMD